MAGLRKNRARYQAQVFIAELFSAVEGQTLDLPAHRKKVGPLLVNFIFSQSNPLTNLISGAFASAGDTDPTTSWKVVIYQSGNQSPVPPFEWAREWIENGRVVPSELTAPHLLFLDRNQGVIYCLDPLRQTAVVVIRRSQHLDIRSFITPFRILWSWIARLNGGVIVHGGCVGIGRAGLVLAGPSGSGKSTLSLTAGKRRNATLVADDCSWAEDGTIWAVYARAKSAAFSEGALTTTGDVNLSGWMGSSQAKFFIDLSFLPYFSESAPLSALVFPQIDLEPGFQEISRERAQHLLVDDSLRELNGGGLRDKLRLAHLPNSLPAFRALLGPNDEENCHLLEEIANAL